MKISKNQILSLLKEMPMDFDTPDRPNPDYEKILRAGETPLKKVPFPEPVDRTQNFQEILGSEAFREVINKYRQYNDEQGPISEKSMMQIYQKQVKVLETISQLEAPHRDELTQLAVELVKRQFAIPEGVINFDAEIVGSPSEISTENYQHDQPGEENPDAPDIDSEDGEPQGNGLSGENGEPQGNEFGGESPENDFSSENTQLEKSKRRLINATLQGASRVGQYMFHMVETEIASIVGREDAPKLYGQMMSMNDLNYWLFPDQMIKQSTESGPSAGSESVEREQEEGGIPTIHASGINFPTLVHELIKGLMELFALKQDGDESDYNQIKGEDTITKEAWDLRLGVAIWRRLKNSVPAELNIEEKQELQNYLLNHIFNLPAKQYLGLMREVMGQTEAGKRAIEKIVRDMEEVYNDVHDRVYRDDDDYNNYDEEGFFQDDEDDDSENEFTPQKTNNNTTRKTNDDTVDFDYEKEPWRLNETYGDRYKTKPWSKRDNLIAFYCSKFDPKNLIPKRNIDSGLALQLLANHYLGTTEDSLKLQISNFRYLISGGDSGMTDYSAKQNEIFEKFNNYNESKLRSMCLHILSTINTTEVYNSFKENNQHKVEYNAIRKGNKLIDKGKRDYNDYTHDDALDMIKNSTRKLKHIGSRLKNEPISNVPTNNDDFDIDLDNDHDNDYFRNLERLNKKLDNPITMDLSKFKQAKRPWNN